MHCILHSNNKPEELEVFKDMRKVHRRECTVGVAENPGVRRPSCAWLSDGQGGVAHRAGASQVAALKAAGHRSHLSLRGAERSASAPVAPLHRFGAAAGQAGLGPGPGRAGAPPQALPPAGPPPRASPSPSPVPSAAQPSLGVPGAALGRGGARRALPSSRFRRPRRRGEQSTPSRRPRAPRTRSQPEARTPDQASRSALPAAPSAGAGAGAGHSSEEEKVVHLWTFLGFTRKPTMSLDDIKMKSSDFLEKEHLDSGGFGKVSLCLHRSHGLVILKKVYTGPKRTEYNESLLEEGRMMHRLRHRRVVKLLGVILEEGNYSLVMEYMEKGNLMHVLKAEVSIPLSVKGRIIMETIEGMCYLHGEGVIHKDLKPENILVDDDFHIKIADLGVASFKTWSKLTKEEINEQRKLNSVSKKNGGTLCYMAPEHLNDINAKPSEKSDVYSFGIVLWAIFANKEPYENAICEQQLILCIKSGNRPDVEDIIEYCPEEIIGIMKQCWEAKPEIRPTFAGIEEKFRPFYEDQLEENVEEDVTSLKKEYPDPAQNSVVKRMQSLQIDCVATPPSRSNSAPEQPSSLHSSQGLGIGPVEESWFAPSLENQQDENQLSLQSKLQEEANYHLYGSRMDRQTKPLRQSVAYNREEERRRRVSHDPFAQQRPYENIQNPGVKGLPYSIATSPGNAVHQPTGLTSQPPVRYWNNELYSPFKFRTRPLALGTTGSRVWYQPNPSHIPSVNKTPVPETNLLGNTPTIPFSSFPSRDESVKCTIYNSSGIQVGEHNYMEVGGVSSALLDMNVKEEPAYKYQDIFDNVTSLTDKHLDPVRENLGKQWKNCARKLGFTEPQIDEIDHDYERDGLKEKVYQMLQKWLMREGNKGATVGKLAYALYQCSRIDLLNYLIHISQN